MTDASAVAAADINFFFFCQIQTLLCFIFFTKTDESSAVKARPLS